MNYIFWEDLGNRLIDGWNNVDFLFIWLHRRQEILSNRPRKADVEQAKEYFDLMATYASELRKLQSLIREDIR